jgi:RNA polymerase sigma-54 factor
MSSFRPKLDLRVSQKQILTPGLVQMVSVLALNKLELKDMINAEMVENPVLEELDGTVPLLDEVAGKEEERLAATDETAAPEAEKKDPFEEIDFGSFFQDYLDPGYRSQSEMESIDKPSFENFLSRPSTLTDHLMWQLGAMHVTDEVYEAAELVIGNLNEDGYLTATEDELMAAATRPNGNGNNGAAPAADLEGDPPIDLSEAEVPDLERFPKYDAAADAEAAAVFARPVQQVIDDAADEVGPEPEIALEPEAEAIADAEPQSPVPGEAAGAAAESNVVAMPRPPAPFTRESLKEAIELVRQMDPIGVAAGDLRD